VREVESWVLGDREGFAEFLGIRVDRISDNPENLVDAKRHLIELVQRSRSRDLIQDIVPRTGSMSPIGPNYNLRLGEFVRSNWRLERASSRVDSLRTAAIRLLDFKPTWAR
jgi:hypothetical protein